MKFFVFFFLCCVALAAAAPQFIAWPGYLAPAVGSRTVVAGPTVVNGFDGLGRFVHPGYVGVI
ncbi:uncharacterized protein LOC123661257 [Melitaea cinxia]|uniref:uncharacterized protein LOC123661257 n=1 Tax=Melitaea cinxia TaxID=113334 RepID=UPI001E274334|nr:uncharacterized protein LOC123661257 [Melitaea cinxia]